MVIPAPILVANLNTFTAPPDASNALFIVWVNDADFVDDMGNIYQPYGTNIIALDQCHQSIPDQPLADHHQSVFAKGVRTWSCRMLWILPKFRTIQHYSSSADKSFIRQMVIDFNTAFAAMLSNAMVSCPGLNNLRAGLFLSARQHSGESRRLWGDQCALQRTDH